jgi:hypothetical protein
MVKTPFYFRLKDLKAKKVPKKYKKELILFSKKDQETSELVTTFNQKEI